MSKDINIQILEDLLEQVKAGTCIIMTLERHTQVTETTARGYFIRHESGVSIEATYVFNSASKTSGRTKYLPTK